MPANLENSALAKEWRRSIFIPIPKKGNAKKCANYCTIVLISHASKVMLKTLQVRLNQELPDVQAGFTKGRGTRDQIFNIRWIIEKAREFQKNICFTDHAKAFDYADHTKLWKTPMDCSPPGSSVHGILQAILIPAYASFSPAFCMIYSAYKLNKQGDNIQS